MSKEFILSPWQKALVELYSSNANCNRASSLARLYCNIPDDNELPLLDRLYFTAALASDGDDEVYMASLLHELPSCTSQNKYSHLMGFTKGMIDAIIKLEELINIHASYANYKQLEEKYQAIVVARNIYRLNNILTYSVDEQELILAEVKKFTFDLCMTPSLYAQLEAAYGLALMVTSDDCDTEDEYLEELILEHHNIAKQFNIAHKQIIELPGIGAVTYDKELGFTDSNGVLVQTSKIIEG